MLEDLLQELANKVSQKRYLSDRITPDDVQTLVSTLIEVGESIPTIVSDIPSVSRDSKDDYLLAYALVGKADYLVTGDGDLLVLKEVEGVKIVIPTDVLEVLKRIKQIASCFLTWQANKAIQQMNNSPLLLPLVCQPLNPEKRLPYQSQNEKLGIYIREH